MNEEANFIEDFCNSTFWNLTLAWDDPRGPLFTWCFEETVLRWLPCLWLAVCALPYAVYLKRQPRLRQLPKQRLNVVKILICLTLAGLAATELIRSLTHRAGQVSTVIVVGSGIQLAAYLLVSVFIRVEFRKGIAACGVPFIFWLLSLLCDVEPLYSRLIMDREEEALFQDLLFARFGLQALSLVLNCYADVGRQALVDGKEPCPEIRSSFLARVTFFWMLRLLYRGYKVALEENHLFALNPRDSTDRHLPKFMAAWQRQWAAFKRSPTNTSLVLLTLLSPIDTSEFVNPSLLKYVIEYVEDKDIPVWKGYFYAVAFFCSSITGTFFFHQLFHLGMTAGMQIKAVLIAAIYRKSLQLNPAGRKDSTVGEVVNLMSVDAQRLQDVAGYLWMLFSAPLQITIAMVLLWQELQASVLAGLAVMILLIPVNGFLASVQRRLQVQQMKNKDNRIKLLNEIFSGIKVLKLYAWELSFQRQVEDIRELELTTLRKAAYLNAVGTFTWTCAPFLVTLTTFATYTLLGNNLTSAKAFTALSLFNILRFPISMLPMLVSYCVTAAVSVRRISKFLSSEELDPDVVNREQHLRGQPRIEVREADFCWERSPSASAEPTLSNVNLIVPDGSLTAVVGTVGSGKSSLVSGILGDMLKLRGQVTLRGSVALVAQQAWIQNATLRDNGINLSGGQKQRVSLARAVYQDADIYILDDPLSAVDSHVGKHIFDNVIGPNGVLAGKTRLFVTNALQWLPFVDNIVVLNHGQLSEQGTYEELVSRNGPFAQFLRQYMNEEKESDSGSEGEDDDIEPQAAASPSTPADAFGPQSPARSRKSSEGGVDGLPRALPPVPPQLPVKEETKKQNRQLIQNERSETGNVRLTVFISYFRSMNAWLACLFFLFFLLYQAASVYSNIWLTFWTSDPYLNNKSSLSNSSEYVNKRNMYLGGYGGIGVAQSVFVLLFAIVAAMAFVISSRQLHSKMLSNILKAPMSFFDTTPVGRIVNRFSRDIETIDSLLPQMFRSWISTFFNVVDRHILLHPLFMTVIVPLGLLYFFIQRFFICTSRQLKRLESTTRSPIYTHFSETVTGTQTIRAYAVVDAFVTESQRRVDFNQIFYFAGISSNRWLGFHLELCGALAVFAATLFAVLGRDTISGAIVGLSVSYALQVTGALNWMVRMSSDLETNIVSVERLEEYASIATEAEWDVPENRPPPNWPDRGSVSMHDLAVRYRDGLELVLHGLTCDVKPGEKVGIVGRTGAGKSSLTLCLFRIVEAARGRVLIDGEDIRRLGLHQLRSRITILPQDPVIFSGTLRVNLDPFNEKTDSEVWTALELAHLKDFVARLPEGLAYQCGEGGSNLSVGQRQLLCLARTLLRKSKILVLDEATAAVDLETDSLIQQTIRREFKDSTVITIAHRLNTILDSDRVLVLDRGVIKEFENPRTLLQRPNSSFYSMAKDAKLV
uniref:ABC-type glutathione-S-conjugate transporter n=1 Tax=Macrostomum lignano TaxID=282301 RepID=A0A1I8JEZ1_9PLAT